MVNINPGQISYYEWPALIPHSALGDVLIVVGMYLAMFWVVISIPLFFFGLWAMTDSEARGVGLAMVVISVIAWWSIDYTPVGAWIPTIITLGTIVIGNAADMPNRRKAMEDWKKLCDADYQKHREMLDTPHKTPSND